MQSRTVGFVGGGRITAIFLETLGGHGIALERVTVSDTNADVLAKLRSRFPKITITAVNAEAAACERVFLALHPPALKAVLPEIKASVRPDSIVVSLAPVLNLARLSELLGGFSRLARVLPNAPSIVRSGFNPVAFAGGLPVDARAEIEALLDALGAHPVVPEAELEAYAILSGMGPTYFWFQWQTLRELAGSFGLGPTETDRALRAMLDGAVRTFFDSGLTAERVMDLVPVKPLGGVRAADRPGLPRRAAEALREAQGGLSPPAGGRRRPRSCRRWRPSAESPLVVVGRASDGGHRRAPGVVVSIDPVRLRRPAFASVRGVSGGDTAGLQPAPLALSRRYLDRRPSSPASRPPRPACPRPGRRRSRRAGPGR